jgi:hypothetical protein
MPWLPGSARANNRMRSSLCPSVSALTDKLLIELLPLKAEVMLFIHRTAFKFGYDLAVPKPLDESVLRTLGLKRAILKSDLDIVSLQSCKSTAVGFLEIKNFEL